MGRLNEMKIRKKLVTGFLIIAMIGSIASVISGVSLAVSNALYSKALVNYGFSQGNVGYVFAIVGAIDGAVHDAVSFSDPKDQEAFREEYATQAEYLVGYLERVGSGLTSDVEKEYYQAAMNYWDEYQVLAKELMEAGNTSDTKEIVKVQERIVTELEPIYAGLYESLAAIMADNVTHGNSLKNTLGKFVIIALIIIVVLILASIVISNRIGKKIADSIAVPVTACAKRLEQLAEGDLNSPVPVVDTKDEIKTLADATKTIVDGLSIIIKDEDYLLDQMAGGNFDIKSTAEEYYVGDFAALLTSIWGIIGSLSKTLREIQDSSSQVAMASSQMAEGATALAEGSTDQASAVQQVLATVTEVADQVGENAQNATEASQRAKEIGKQAKESNEQMSRMTEAMNRISETSKQISVIVDSIDSIASQTNLLSLNASIEAARAGEAGRGFAVVAEEIRQLATQSSEAANNTRQLIETSLKEVENGNVIAVKTAESLSEVTDGILHVVDVVDHVRKASDNQSQSMHQLSDGIGQISSVIQSNSATAEESSATSEELSAQAETLNNLVEEFKLKEEKKKV